ncbi:MAG: hypothetical protein IPG17_29480 [Sandaracinaceae bacterium]|nr:hypothetical protein [Sandaracinaceae bacterium]
MPHLEGLRRDLRGIMKYQQRPRQRASRPGLRRHRRRGLTRRDHIPRLEGLDLVEYRARVEQVLSASTSPRTPPCSASARARPCREEELEELARAGPQIDDKANVKHLAGRDPETRRSLLDVFRGLVGLDAAAVEQAFTAFAHAHPRLTSQQLRFLSVLQNHIAQNGGIELERLYEPPFTTIHAESMDGIFTAQRGRRAPRHPQPSNPRRHPTDPPASQAS